MASDGKAQEDTHLSARTALSGRRGPGQTPAGAPGSGPAVLQCRALRGAAAPAADAGRSFLAGRPRAPTLTEAGTAGPPLRPSWAGRGLLLSPARGCQKNAAVPAGPGPGCGGGPNPRPSGPPGAPP